MSDNRRQQPGADDQHHALRVRSTDFNLLYGIMALRVALITSDQLIAAMNSWVDQKTTPLDKLMRESGIVSETDGKLLNALVDAFIRKHDKEAQRGLESLTPLGPIQEQLHRLNDPDVDASLQHIGKACDPNDLAATVTWTSSSSKDRFRVLRFHAQGGLGKVSVALDTEVNREVALKEIQEAFADNPVARSRFVREGEVTGRLEHPGIVPVYGLGHFDDGRPFYAMRYVHGHNLKLAIEQLHQTEHTHEKRIALRRLIERFIDVCDAIEYAHARGVLHRDLKPGNIMIGQYGETLVVDWGLAKPIKDNHPVSDTSEDALQLTHDSGHQPTSYGSAIGSPAYMSPEQASGQLDKLGVSTDIFGLGATLYHLLAGVPPIQGDNNRERLENAKLAKYPPPLQVRSDIPDALNVVCTKAMAKEPEQRYGAVGELRDAIQNWLDDEPIAALRTAANYVEELHRTHPDRTEYQERLGRELSGISRALLSLDRNEEALEVAHRAVDLLEGLFRRDPTDLQHFQELFYARTQLAATLRATGSQDKARQVEENNKQQFTRLLKASPKNEDVQQALFSLTLRQGFSMEEANRLLNQHKAAVDDRLDSSISPEVTPAYVDDRYTLIEVNDESAYGVVYRARDNVLWREVALRTSFVGERSLGHDNNLALLREAAILGRLEHPSIPPVFDFSKRDDYTSFFATKLINGRFFVNFSG